MVRSAVGMAILKKQGWVVGQVLGRGCPYGSAFGAGSLHPLEFLIKTDQAGLLCAEERAAIKAKKYGDVMPHVITEQLPAPRSTISGRHPIAALADYCHQQKWKQPEYTLVKEEGVDHKKLFIFQVVCLFLAIFCLFCIPRDTRGFVLFSYYFFGYPTPVQPRNRRIQILSPLKL